MWGENKVIIRIEQNGRRFQRSEELNCCVVVVVSGAQSAERVDRRAEFRFNIVLQLKYKNKYYFVTIKGFKGKEIYLPAV